MNVHQQAMEFLEQHRNANDIYVDVATGLPVKVVYSGLDCTGNYRKQPAVFWFSYE